MTADPVSLVGQTLVDVDLRSLKIEAVQQGDPTGREIVGTLTMPSGQVVPYATTFATFRDVWIERMPEVSPEQQERNRKNLGV